ncbi:hypothetical protein VTN77DRAFT_2030 [Rasamsonia byssochlamydoides]|uniref:uncharacterized protein n=1 Tax=Rasamsonia byssochlamydoides TaxID=89139 RepID=UPI003741E9B9
MKFTSVAAAFALVNAVLAAPAPARHPDVPMELPSSLAIPTSLPTPTGFPVPTGFPGHHKLRPTGTVIIPTGTAVSGAHLPTATSSSPFRFRHDKAQRRPVRRNQHEASDGEPSLHVIPTGRRHHPTGRLIPTGTGRLRPTGRVRPTGHLPTPTGSLPTPTGQVF